MANESAKFEIIKVFFPLHMIRWKGFYQNSHYWKQICCKTIKYIVCERVHVHLLAGIFIILLFVFSEMINSDGFNAVTNTCPVLNRAVPPVVSFQ